MSRSVLEKLNTRMSEQDDALGAPDVSSFKQFLTDHCRVKSRDGSSQYSSKGREAIAGIVDRIDDILGSHTGKPKQDATLAVCGGAQWGKTVLGLNFTGYVTGRLFRNVGYYLPDDDLVQGVVDGKFRPEFVDLNGWYARMLSVGKTLNESGKAVNRKGAFMVTDGRRSGLGMFRGMGKIPTTFTMDATVQDEKDDIPEKTAKFLSGRMTSSDLRMQLIIGTQRIAGAGQNKAFEEGTQEVRELVDPITGEGFCPEECWPGICRVAMDGAPKRSDPKLGFEAVFKRDGSDAVIFDWDPEAHYYFANPQTGTPLDRSTGRWVMRRPDRVKERKFSMRVSQMGIAAIDLVQIVNHWRDAVADPDQMIVFSCDRLAMPKSTLQQLDQKIVDRSRTTSPFPMGYAAAEGVSGRFAGVDAGDRCWFTVRDVVGPAERRIQYAEQISLGRIKTRVVELFHRLNLDCVFIDARPAADEARTITWAIHGLLDYDWPKIPDPEKAYIQFGGGLAWDGPANKWKGLKAAVVEFALKRGQGVRHKLGITMDGEFYPVIQCNRDESIQAVINEMLTAEEGLVQVIDGKLREDPILRLPMVTPGSPPAAEVLGNHFLAGSKKQRNERTGDENFIDKVENHYLLTAVYARLAETIGGGSGKQGPFAFEPVGSDDAVKYDLAALDNRRRVF